MGPQLYKRGFDDDVEILKAKLAEESLLLEVLALVNSLSSKGKTFEQFCKEVGKILQQKLKFKYIHIWIRDEKDPSTLQLLTPEEDATVRTVSINRGIIGKCVRETRTICLPDVFADSDYMNVRPEVRSELCVPLISDDSVMGAINIETDYCQTFEGRIAIIGIIAQHLSNFIKIAMLHQTEESFHSLVENMREGVWVGDPDEKTLYSNKALQNMLGYSKEELLGMPSFNFFDEASKEILRRQNEMRKMGLSGQYEVLLVSKTGERIPAIVQGAPYGKGGTMSTLTDLRDLKSAEKKLQQAEQFLASVTQHCSEAIIGLSPNAIIQSWNIGAEHMFGHKAEEMAGKPVGLLVPEEMVLDSREEYLMQEVKRKGLVRNFETIRLHKNGKTMNVCLTLSGIKDKGGKIIGYSALYRDITIQKKWERELQNRFEKIQEAYREMGKQRRYLDYLVDIINMAASNNYTIKQMANFVVNAMVMMSKVDAATLRLIDESNGKLFLKAQSGVGEEWWTKKALPYAGSLVEKAAKQGHPLKILDILSDPRYDSPNLARKNNLRSALVIPLEVKGAILGSLTLYLASEGNLSLLDDEFINIFAKQAALALKFAKQN